MRVAINTEEIKFAMGFFRKEPRWRVECAIEFTEEELAIIRQRKLGNVHVCAQQFGDGRKEDCTLGGLVKHGKIWGYISRRAMQKSLKTS